MKGRNVDLSRLTDLPRSELVDLWQACFGSEPPKGISQRLMVGAIAYEQQAKQQGGLNPALSRTLAKLGAGERKNQAVTAYSVRQRQLLSPGSRLVREWNGITQVVDVVDDGFVWDGNRYRSLSAIARAITGARWSGPRFFGLGL
jgi:hypothetical protein